MANSAFDIRDCVLTTNIPVDCETDACEEINLSVLREMRVVRSRSSLLHPEMVESMNATAELVSDHLYRQRVGEKLRCLDVKPPVDHVNRIGQMIYDGSCARLKSKRVMESVCGRRRFWTRSVGDVMIRGGTSLTISGKKIIK
ncbi:Hypothetical predicted protein [Paramuricea clavata]|uniref:Uncharacterized protein n=1 Tax=Paramuricea clavata TaxID=317549 RepID=A0A7D9H8J3_PARCT|nr:Hypothetical predicted protein [Paramuricea clavata]